MLDSIATESGLDVSTDRTTARLLELTTSIFPKNWPITGLVRTNTIRAANNAKTNPSIDPADQREYRLILQNAQRANSEILLAFEQVIDANPQAASALTPSYERMRDEMAGLLGNFERGAANSNVFGIPAERGTVEALRPTFDAQAVAFKSAVDQLGVRLKEVQAQTQTASTLSLLLTLLALSLALVLAYLIAQAITRALQGLTDSANRLQQGDFAVRTPIQTADEFATLGRSLNTAAAQLEENERRVAQEREEAVLLQNNIGEFLDVTMDIAEGDLTKRGRVTEDILGNVVDSINYMTDELAQVLKGAQLASQSVTGGSRTMLLTTEAINEGTLTTSEAARRVAEQTAEVNANIQEMARIAERSAQAARQALEASQQGQMAVVSTLEEMQSIRESTQSVAQRVQELGRRSAEIQDIVDAITHIASQTNLLSLHASIEAAGAGEAGQRFSVVADEVRQLADLSAQETNRIAGLISTIQREIREVTQSIQANAQQVEQGYAVAGTAGERLREIGALSEQSAELAQSISQATVQQVQGVQQVGSAVEEIASVAQRSQESVEQGRAAAEQLQRLADQLNSSLSRFRLPS
ncbi:methyl-accepting chemotaxis protein [Deinococcus lacus]|uniref:Methyl-accepting chemotaxis protein n=1 Tax=Deinococcus lacus TaxID=392561 RepID=A0ABW1YE79_9DEIO